MGKIVGFIVVGDRTSHGGVVLTGDATCDIDGRPIARVGDTVFCPRCKRQTTIVTSNNPTIFFSGPPAAFHGDMTDCGAVLLSRHNNHSGWTVESEADEVRLAAKFAPAETTRPAAAPDEPYTPAKTPRFQEHFILRNGDTGEPLADLPYVIKTGDGQEFRGETDSEGRTAVVWTDSSEPVEVFVQRDQGTDDDPYHFPEHGYTPGV